MRFHGSDHPHAKLLEINALPVRLQKAVFQLAKGRLYKQKDGLLQGNMRHIVILSVCNVLRTY